MGDTNSLFQRLGGEAKLREIIDAFIDRVFADRMIGFFFRNADRERIKEMEFQLAAEFLGAEIGREARMPLVVVLQDVVRKRLERGVARARRGRAAGARGRKEPR